MRDPKREDEVTCTAGIRQRMRYMRERQCGQYHVDVGGCSRVVEKAHMAGKELLSRRGAGDRKQQGQLDTTEEMTC